MKSTSSTTHSTVEAELPLLQLPDSNMRSEPTTLQLILAAKTAADTKARTEAELEEDPQAKASPRKLTERSLRLPHLRVPTKEPEPTDPDFTVRLGAFLKRLGEDSFTLLLHKEFLETEPSSRVVQRNSEPSCLTVVSPNFTADTSSNLLTDISPGPTTALSSLGNQKRANLKSSGYGSRAEASGSPPRRASVTLSNRRRYSTQLLKGGDCLAPLPGSSYITESESGFVRFQRIARIVKVIVKVCNALKSFVERSDTESWSFVEMYLHVQEDMRQDLAFNRHNFTKVQPLNGGPRLQRLLAVWPEKRTARHIQQIMAVLRIHSGFNDFPLQVQIQLCRAMHYEMYESRRILLRQGQQPTGFYMLLTGSLMVNIRDVHPSSGHVFIRTVSDLKEGDCFGELALLEHIPRTATIICKTAVELLSISKEDFERIIRRPLLLQRDQLILYCQNHPLFQDFPCDMFYSNPEGFFFQYCPAGLVVVKNGQSSTYMVLVKSGKCNLVGTYNSSELTRKRLESASHDVQRAFPLYTEVLKIASAVRKRPVESVAFRVELKIYHRRRPQTNRSTHPELHCARDRVEIDLMEQVLGGKQSKASVQMTSEDPGKEAQESYWACRLHGPALQKSGHVRGRSDRRSAKSTSSQQTLTAEPKMNRLDFLRANKEGFAEIAQLSAGDVFGLETLFKRPASRVSLLSQGAELIFISKKLFLQHANIRVLRIVNDMSIAYPSAVHIHSMLKYRQEWTRYKHALVRHVVTRVGRSYEPTPYQT